MKKRICWSLALCLFLGTISLYSTMALTRDTHEVTRVLGLFDEIGGNRIGLVSPYQTVIVRERHCERWIKIDSWLGRQWLDLGPQLPNFVDPSLPMIALTFDDGPTIHTQRILDTFELHGANATFFVRGDRVVIRPNIVKEAHDRGFEVVGHTWSHPNLTRLPADQIESQIIRTHDAIEALIGPVPMIYRPPFGSFNSTVREASRNAGFAIIHWSRDPRDWEVRNSDAVFRRVVNEAYDGAIVVLHDTHGTTATAMERAVPELIARGFQLVTVSELFYYRGIELEPGTVYFHAPVRR